MKFTEDISFYSAPRAGSDLTLAYKGFLSNSDEVWIVYGFDEAWSNTSEVKMKKTEHGFEASIEILDFKTFNFCFKNANNEWDNNNSCNYVSTIEPSYNSELISLFDELFNDDTFEIESIEAEPLTESIDSCSVDFDIDKLIEEILQPIVVKETESFTAEDIEPSVISENFVDLGDETNEKIIIELTEDEEIVPTLSVTDDVTTESVDSEFFIEDVAKEYTNEFSMDSFSTEETTNDVPTEEVTNDISSKDDVELSIPVNPLFAISPRKLSKFYLFKKRVRLFVYKIARLPQLIFGEEKN